MPPLALLTSTLRRSRGDLPQLPLINMFVEKAVTEPTQFALQSRPGLSPTGNEYGAGPINALLQEDGVVQGAVVAISDSNIYVGAANVGGVGGNEWGSIAGNEIGAIATKGQDAVFWDGTTFRSIDLPDDAYVTKVFEQGGRFLFIQRDTQKFYWTEPLANMLDGNGDIVIDPLNYASAENEPDKLLDAVVMEDALILAGANSIEFWPKTGDDNLPYMPTTGRTYSKGVRATGCLTLFDNTFAWVGQNNIVYRYASVPQAISDEGLEELIAASQICSVSAFYFEGHEFLKIHLDDRDLLYDAKTLQWCEWVTYGQPGFVGGPSIDTPDGPRFGSRIDGKLLALRGDTDLGGLLERSFRAGFPMDGSSAKIANCGLRTNPGQTSFLDGQYADPIVEMRISRDGGQTWSAMRHALLGQQGQYRKRIEWRGLGLVDPPGFLAEFRVTDPVGFRVSGAYFNEAGGGRSR